MRGGRAEGRGGEMRREEEFHLRCSHISVVWELQIRRKVWEDDRRGLGSNLLISNALLGEIRSVLSGQREEGTRLFLMQLWRYVDSDTKNKNQTKKCISSRMCMKNEAMLKVTFWVGGDVKGG